jgi:hypothetical protein
MPRKVSAGLGLALVLLASSQHACSTAPDGHTPEPISITKWTNKTELFVEFPPLMVGKATSFAAHLTDLATFHPVSGEVLMTMLHGQYGKTLTARAAEATSPGIYHPVLTPTEAGTYRLVFQRSHPETQAVLDTIDAGKVQVVELEDDLPSLETAPAEEGITFLKEQQWHLDFATEQVMPRDLLVTLQLRAEVKPAAGGEVRITAPIAGRVLAVEKSMPAPGQLVEPGEPLALILPLPSKSQAELEYVVSATRAELDAAEHELARVQDLYADRIVPKRRLEQAQKNTAVLKARLSATRAQLSLLDVNPAQVTKATLPGLQRFGDVNRRFDDVNSRFNDVNQRFDDVNRRFDDVNSRLSDIMTLLQLIVSALVVLVLATAGAGFVMWRKILVVDAAVQTKIGLD